VKGVASLEVLLSSDSDTLSVHQILRDATLRDKSLRGRLTLAAALNPFLGMSYTFKKKQVPLVDSVIRDGLKVYLYHVCLLGSS
jgi:hypothetical protein